MFQLDSLETKTFNEIDAIVNLAWEGKKLPEQEKLIVKILNSLIL